MCYQYSLKILKTLFKLFCWQKKFIDEFREKRSIPSFLLPIRPVKWGFKKGKKLGKTGIFFIIFRTEFFITHQFCTPEPPLLWPPSWKNGGRKQFFWNILLNIYFIRKCFKQILIYRQFSTKIVDIKKLYLARFRHYKDAKIVP